ncbi:NUDIX hydrolase [Ruminococcus sp. NK3A76]|uniref:NUDIX hydrolase n=1 Tax=Ruminococcus sp. NK3A76 TaxID=877411 RepID=UPI00068C02A0|nr:NUDIX hydrolase [Ruminococcus sp. NK3A76]
MPEYWDLYDRQLRPLGKKYERDDSKQMPKGEFHIVANILSVNRQGRMLITRRYEGKNHGGYWEISGGSVLSGEQPVDGAARELFEETGLKADPGELRYMGQIIRESSGCIHNFYLYEGDFTEADITLQEGETTDFKLVWPREIERMAYADEFLDFLFYRIKAVYGDWFYKHK